MDVTVLESQRNLWMDSQDDPKEWETKALSRHEAQMIERGQPSIVMWFAIRFQLFFGGAVVLISLLFGFWAAVCAAIGVACVLLPTILFVWRVSSVRASQYGASFSLINFYFWEFVKVVCIILMLVGAFLYVKPLLWQALLAGFIVTIKAYGIGCIVAAKKVNR